MLDVQSCLDWAKEQPGVTSARVDIHIETIAFPEKLNELERIAKPEHVGFQKSIQHYFIKE